MSTSGALHLAESAKWLAWEQEHANQQRLLRIVHSISAAPRERCTLAEAAAAHEGRPVVQWLIEFLARVA